MFEESEEIGYRYVIDGWLQQQIPLRVHDLKNISMPSLTLRFFLFYFTIGCWCCYI